MVCLADIAELETTGTLSESISPEKKVAFENRWIQLFKAEVERRSGERGQPGWHEMALATLEQGATAASMLGTLPPPMGLGLENLLAAYLTNTWTTFETMSGDLWEAALNSNPSELAHLGGDPRRLVKGAKNFDGTVNKRVGEGDSKSVPLDLIQMHGYDTRKVMGTILRERFEFSRLSDVRRAYACAFRKDTIAIDDALSNKALDALSVVRNIIVHKAGNADEIYMKNVDRLKLPPAALGKPILLTGDNVVGLISPVIQSAANLMAAVDNWILKNQKA